MEVVGVTDAKQKVVDKLNELAETRFLLELKLEEENTRFATEEAQRKAEHAARLGSIQEFIDQADAGIWEILDRERSQLIAASKKSFATMVAKWQLRESAGSLKVTDAAAVAAVMKVAKRFGVVKQIAEPPSRKWKFSIKKFRAWLDKEPQMKPLFEDYIEETEAGETLTIQNNGTYTVVYDGKRISPPSVSIKKKS